MPGTLVPGRQKPQEPPQPSLEPLPTGPETTVPTAAAPAGAESLSFVLKEVDLSGATVFSKADLESIWKPLLGQDVTVAAVFEIANKITARYADKGYVLSFAYLPEQEIEDGSVTIMVVEGYVSRVAFGNADGSPDAGATQIPAIVHNLARDILKSRPLNKRDMERSLLLMNDYPGINARATFQPDEVQKGASAVIIEIDRIKPISVTASADNYLTPELDRYNGIVRMTLDHAYTGTTELARACGLSCSVYDYANIVWTKMLSDGWLFRASASASNQKPKKGILSLLDFTGNSRDYTTELSYPILRGREMNLTAGGRLVVTDSETKTFIGTLTEDRIRTGDLFLNADLADRYGGSTVARLTYSEGLPIFNYTKDSDANKSRAGGSATFSMVDFYAARDQDLSYFSSAFANYSFYGAMQFRTALNDPLLSGSQCYYGGNAFGRGYNNGAVSGDHCIMGSMELRRSIPPSTYLPFLQAYAFVDGGRVYRKGPLAPAEAESDQASSFGTGLRFWLGDHGYGDFGVAVPIARTGTPNGERNPRYLISLTLNY